jgi:hypothetical protein
MVPRAYDSARQAKSFRRHTGARADVNISRPDHRSLDCRRPRSRLWQGRCDQQQYHQGRNDMITRRVLLQSAAAVVFPPKASGPRGQRTRPASPTMKSRSGRPCPIAGPYPPLGWSAAPRPPISRFPTGRMRQNRSFSRSFLRTRRVSGRRTPARPLTAGRPYRIALPRLVAGR